MCGIAGIFHYGTGAAVDPERIDAMTRALVHRGPDAGGAWCDGAIGLGHRRLAIIDVALGQQPMRSRCGDVWISFNGEIYNHRELRPTLESRGHRFGTKCDTEVIIHEYEERGPAFPERLSGMFALAIWDDARQRLVLARDRLGIKPLFYYDSGRSLYFASELRALLRIPEIPRELDPASVHHYLDFEFVPSPRTILRGVRRLGAGETLVVQRSGPVRIRPYWRLGYEPKLRLSEAEAVEGFRERFSRAVERRLMSDVPLGAFLSGGIDSSAIVAEMARHSGRRLQTFSIGFDDASYDESPYSRLVSRHFDTEHHTEVVRAGSLESIDELIDRLDEPLADSSMLPTLLLSRLARREVTVCLSGDGGDELLAGYERHVASLLARRSVDRVPALARPLFAGLARLVPGEARKKGPANKVKRFLEGAAKDVVGRQFRWQSFSSESLQQRLYRDPMREAAAAEGPFARVVELWETTSARDRLDRELAVETELYLQDDILPKLDGMSMAVSLEARVPFLDHELVEYVARLPTPLKHSLGRSKVLLRRAMEGVLPPEILTRPKEGFGMPLKKWLRTELYERVRESFGSSRLSGLLRADAAIALLDDHRSRRDDHSHVLWALYLLEEWCRRHLDPPSRAS